MLHRYDSSDGSSKRSNNIILDLVISELVLDDDANYAADR